MPAKVSKERLSANHAWQLRDGSGIDPKVTAERGTYSALGKDVPQDLGWLPKKPGIVFPVHTIDGDTFYRLKPNKPGRYPKYMQPKGMPNRLDIHPRIREELLTPGGRRYITEGEKKTDCGVSRGLLIIGLSGVWNSQKDKKLIADWDLLPLDGEEYAICFDSDMLTNPQVQDAADRLARLLQARGATVLLTALPAAADGSKQGLDDYFVNGGTVEELDAMTSPYDPTTVETLRLSKDERLREAIGALNRQLWAEEWRGVGGHTDRDVYLKLIEAARKAGKLTEFGVRVVKAQGPLAIEAAVSSRTIGNAIKRLEERGLILRDNAGRRQEEAGAFLLSTPGREGRAKVSHMKQGSGDEEQGLTREDSLNSGNRGACGDFPLRAPRAYWTRPKHKPRKGIVRGTSKVRMGAPLGEEREQLKRLGKIRLAIVDVLSTIPGEVATLDYVCARLGHKRPRDIRKRSLGMLVKVGVLWDDGERIGLTDDWEIALDEQRLIDQEIDLRVTLAADDGTKTEFVVEGAETIARRRLEIKRRAFRNRDRLPAADKAPSEKEMETQRILRQERERIERERPVSPLAGGIHEFLRKNPGEGKQSPVWLANTVWSLGYCDKATISEARAAIEELGGKRYLEDREYQFKLGSEGSPPPPRNVKAPEATLEPSAAHHSEPPVEEHSLACECDACAIPEPKYAKARGVA